MQSKFLKIVLAWIGAFFCAWLFGNKMLDTPLPPPLFFLAAALYTSIVLARGKVETVIKFRNGKMYEEKEKISVFRSVSVKIFTLWTIVILCFMIFRANTFTFLVGIILFVSFIYLPILFWGYKCEFDEEKEKSEKILKVLSCITYFTLIIFFYDVVFSSNDSIGLRVTPLSVRFYEGLLVSIIFYFLTKYTAHQWYDWYLQHTLFDFGKNYMAICFGIQLFFIFCFCACIKGIAVG